MSRKTIAITAYGSHLVALCDDGTMWWNSNPFPGDGFTNDWQELTGVPGDAPATSITPEMLAAPYTATTTVEASPTLMTAQTQPIISALADSVPSDASVQQPTEQPDT